MLAPGAFRLLLAAAVLFSHLSRVDIGLLAVILFFFLSGYWVSRIWVEKFSGSAVGRFYASRYFRIIPLYLLVLVGAALATGQTIKPMNLLLLGLATTEGDLIGVSWSLDIELQFYLLTPLLVPLAAARPWWVSLGATMALAAVTWAFAAHYDIRVVTQYLPAFLLGAFTFLYDWKPSRGMALWSLAAFVAFSALAAVTPWTSVFVDSTKEALRPFSKDIFAFFWMLPLLPYVAHSLSLPSGKLDRHLGNLSYPLYLVHWPVIAVLKQQFGGGLEVKALAVVVSCALALALYVAFDRPIDALRLRFFERRREKALEPVEAET